MKGNILKSLVGCKFSVCWMFYKYDCVSPSFKTRAAGSHNCSIDGTLCSSTNSLYTPLNGDSWERERWVDWV